MTTQTRNEVMDGMAALGEQFRLMTEAVTGQARQTMSAAQDQLQQNLSRAQQAQTDVAPMLARLNELNCQIASSAFASVWDVTLALNKMTTWSQEQTERTLLQAMEQNRISREEATALIKETTEQTRRHQAELYGLVQECLRTGFVSAEATTQPDKKPAR